MTHKVYLLNLLFITFHSGHQINTMDTSSIGMPKFVDSLDNQTFSLVSIDVILKSVLGDVSSKIIERRREKIPHFC